MMITDTEILLRNKEYAVKKHNGIRILHNGINEFVPFRVRVFILDIFTLQTSRCIFVCSRDDVFACLYPPPAPHHHPKQRKKDSAGYFVQIFGFFHKKTDLIERHINMLRIADYNFRETYEPHTLEDK
jgi:hypothetical protein